MRIHAHVLTWNEEVQLPITLRHYQRFCEKIFIYDNESTDKTREIAIKADKTELLTYPTNNKFDDMANAYVKSQAWKTSIDIADWVIVVDCDELVWHPDIHNYLAKMKEEQATIISPQWWNMIGTDLPGFDNEFPMGQKHPFGKPVVFDPSMILEINYYPGAHECKPMGYINRVTDDAIKTLHYKHHSLEYVLTRYDIYRQRMSEINLKAKFGNHYFEENAVREENFKELLRNAEALPQ